MLQKFSCTALLRKKEKESGQPGLASEAAGKGRGKVTPAFTAGFQSDGRLRSLSGFWNGPVFLEYAFIELQKAGCFHAD